MEVADGREFVQEMGGMGKEKLTQGEKLRRS